MSESMTGGQEARPQTQVKAPWVKNLGDVPAHLEYPQWSMCEGVEKIAEEIEKSTGIESRATILGHVQRGGNPTVRDRVIATQMGYAAVKLLKGGIGNRVIGLKKGEIVNYDIYEALNMKKPFDDEMYEIAHTTSI